MKALFKKQKPKLIMEVRNFFKHKEVWVTIKDETGKELILKPSKVFANKKWMSQMSREDSNRISFLTAFELLG